MRNPGVAMLAVRCYHSPGDWWHWPATMATRRPGCSGCCCCYRCCYLLLRCQLVMQSTNQTRASVNVKEAFARRVASRRVTSRRVASRLISFRCAASDYSLNWRCSLDRLVLPLFRKFSIYIMTKYRKSINRMFQNFLSAHNILFIFILRLSIGESKDSESFWVDF